jgi:acyl dehydratase
MKFADFHAGQVIDAGPYEIGEAEMIRFATAYDPQWFHIDPGAAAQGPFEGLIASGWHSCGIAMRLVVDRVLHDSESFASPGLKYLKWLQPVRPGDRLSLRLTVLEARRSARRPDLGILEWRWQLRNQHEVEVLELEVTSMFNLKTE